MGPNYLPIKVDIGKREGVGYGVNGEETYVDSTLFPFPAIRFKEDTAEIALLREKEKGDHGRKEAIVPGVLLPNLRRSRSSYWCLEIHRWNHPHLHLRRYLGIHVDEELRLRTFARDHHQRGEGQGPNRQNDRNAREPHRRFYFEVRL